MSYATYVLAWLCIVGTWQSVKPLPENLNMSSREYQVSDNDIDFLGDLTFTKADSQVVSEQEIFDTIFEMIDNAEQYILLDMFLFNPDAGNADVYRSLSRELTDKLIRKKKSHPDLPIDLITDPVNTLYGGSPSEQLFTLEKAGVNVIVTDLRKLRDSNPLYSSIWRTFFQWFGNSPNYGILPHPLGKDDHVTMRSYLVMLNMKANHRKLIVADNGDEMRTIVCSANPHDASSAHSNVALDVSGDLWRSIWKTESSVAKFSDGELYNAPELLALPKHNTNGTSNIRVVSEKAIRDSMYDIFDLAGEGDQLSLAMFYLSERGTVKKLLKAAENGAEIRLLLDPNKDAFGHSKNGIPNRQVARELLKKSNGHISIRWYDTHGEQFHTKMLISQKVDGKTSLLLGSANYTRRNIENYNLELDLLIETESPIKATNEAITYFSRCWNNSENRHHSTDFPDYEDPSFFKKIVYRIQEFAGLSSF